MHCISVSIPRPGSVVHHDIHDFASFAGSPGAELSCNQRMPLGTAFGDERCRMGPDFSENTAERYLMVEICRF